MLLLKNSCSSLAPGKPRGGLRNAAFTSPRSWLDRWTQKPAASMMDKWWDGNTLAVVTGANKGIGFEIARMLHEAGLQVILTSRSEDLGKAAVNQLGGPSDSLVYHQLDISQPASVAAFADWVKATYGKLDILVNNAGIAYKGNTFGPDEAATTLATNFLGTVSVCESLRPLMSPGARIVNVSSTSGLLSNIPSAEIRSKLDNPTGIEELRALGEKFVSDVRAGQHAQAGWSNSMYGISKALESSYTRLLAKQLQDQGIMVNACCPGYCATDMSSWRGTQSAAAGADTPVWLALAPPESFMTGGFFRERAQRSF